MWVVHHIRSSERPRGDSLPRWVRNNHHPAIGRLWVLVDGEDWDTVQQVITLTVKRPSGRMESTDRGWYASKSET